MYTKSIASFLIIVSVIFSFQVQVARAAVIVDLVESIADTIQTVADVATNITLQTVDIMVVVVVSVVTLGVCSPFGPCGGILDPFLEDLTCRPGFGASPGALGLACGGDNLGGSGGNTFNPNSTLATTSASPTCTQLTLSGINPQGHNYAMLRDGIVVKQLTSSDTSFTDSGLTPHTNYSYVVRLPDPPEAGFQTSDSAPLVGYTKCLPQCGFGVDSSSIANFSSTNLRWTCLNNDPSVDIGSCKIVDSNNVSQTVSAVSGVLQVSPSADITYTLTCTNVDGPISIPQSVSIFIPGIKEVKP